MNPEIALRRTVRLSLRQPFQIPLVAILLITLVVSCVLTSFRSPAIQPSDRQQNALPWTPTVNLATWDEHKTLDDLCWQFYGVGVARKKQVLRYLLSNPITELNHVRVRRTLACALHSSDSTPLLAQQEIEALADGYVSRYIQIAQQKEAIVFHHASKAGGSDVCDRAWLNGCRAPSSGPMQPAKRELVSGTNCFAGYMEDNVKWRLGAQRSKPEGFYSCERRLDFVRKSGINFMAIENYLPQAPCQEGLLTFIVFRDVVDRAFSHLRHLLERRFDWISEGCLFSHEKDSPREARYHITNMTCMFRENPVPVNNYYTRTLAGEQGFQAELFNRDDKLFSKAVVALLQFDIILVSPSPLKSTGGELGQYMDADLTYQIGLGFLHKLSKRSHTTGQLQGVPVEELRRHLRSLNNLDLDLYRLASQAAQLDASIFNLAMEYCRTVEPDELGMSHACRAFSFSEPAINAGIFLAENMTGSYETQKRVRIERQEPFACGCGWVGSLETNRGVPPLLPSVLGLPAEAKCPRHEMFSPL